MSKNKNKNKLDDNTVKLYAILIVGAIIALFVWQNPVWTTIIIILLIIALILYLIVRLLSQINVLKLLIGGK